MSAKIISIDTVRSEDQAALADFWTRWRYLHTPEGLRLLATPEAQERRAQQAKEQSRRVVIDDLPAGVCFAKIHWGHGHRHYLWSALITLEHPDGGLYGARKSTAAMAEYYENGEAAPHDRCAALKLVDRDLFDKATVYDGPDPLVLFDDVFAAFPSLMERKVAEHYDTLMCLRAVEAFRRHPFVPGDDVGLRRFVKFLEDRRKTMRKTHAGLTVGLDFGDPMVD